MPAVALKGERVQDGYESSILDIVRDTWRKSVPEHQKSDGTMEALMAHSGRMGKILGTTADYEAICVPNILEHMKYMSLQEARSYMHMMERLGNVYKQMYGTYIAGLLMIGVSKMAKDASGVTRHLDYVVERVKSRSSRHERLSNREADALRVLSARRFDKGRSIFSRLFGKGEIALLDAAIAEKKRRIRGHSKRQARYTDMLNGPAGKQPNGSK